MLGTVGLLGPVRKLALLTYSATCPNCLGRHALRIHITPGGELPRCTAGCSLADVIQATKDTAP